MEPAVPVVWTAGTAAGRKIECLKNLLLTVSRDVPQM